MIIDKIDQQIVKEYAEESKLRDERKFGIYWPSQASAKLSNGEIVGMCLRQSFYEIKHVAITNIPSAKSIRKMRYGLLIEAEELKYAKNAGILLESQVVFEKYIDNIIIRGKIDGIYGPDPKGIEIKTGSGYYFKNEIWGTDTKSGNPRYNNLLQVILYLDGFKEHKTFKFNEAYLVYINRESGDTQEFKIRLQAGYPMIWDEIDYGLNINNIYARYKKLHYYISQNILPPCDYHNMYTINEIIELYSTKRISKTKYKTWYNQGFGTDYQCEYCKWLDYCRKDNVLK